MPVAVACPWCHVDLVVIYQERLLRVGVCGLTWEGAISGKHLLGELVGTVRLPIDWVLQGGELLHHHFV